MKKLLSIGTALILTVTGLRAQDTSVVVTDTLHYFFNKYYFKTGTKMNNFPNYKSAFATTTVVTHIGSKFVNNEPIDIFGLEAFVTRKLDATKLSVPVHLYLCTLVNNMPVLPAIDSVMLSVSGPPEFKNSVGGNFKNGAVHRMEGDFAVLLRNMSITAGDTVHVLRTAGKTHTNLSVPWSEKNSDGYGYVRYGGQFYSATNYTIGGGSTFPHSRSGFGIGTDYEFCIAPRATYTLYPAHAVDPDATKPLCTWEVMDVTNLSSKRYMQRQYNLVEFARYWQYTGPFAPGTDRIKIKTGPGDGDTLWTDVFPSDSSITWYFAPEDVYDNQHAKPRLFLPYNTTTNKMTFMTDSSNYTELGADSTTCFYTNEFRTRHKAMAIYGRGSYTQYNDTFVICTNYCGLPWVISTKEAGALSLVRVYPNPSSGKAIITGLSDDTRVRVYDILGQVIHSEATKGDRLELDLSQQPPGTYLIRLSDARNERTVRLIRN